MRTVFVVLLLCSVAFVPLLAAQDDYGSSYELFTPEQLDNLLAPIALYPDPLLAQVLLAATFPDQIDEASRFVRANPDPGYIDAEPWDVSVKAVAHYPMVLQRMSDRLDWTTSLGQAYVNQSTDVMDAVQRLRAEARSAGNLITTPEQEIVDDAGYIEIWPAQPRVIYVPVYDPSIVYFGRGGIFAGGVISFGRGFALGVWLNHDCDWRGHRVYYHGWNDDRGWVRRSRPYVQVTNVYVNVNYRNVVVNRTVVNRSVNYNNLNRYRSIHQDVVYNNVRVNNRENRQVVVERNANVNNKIIERNINTNDPRLNTYRGHPPEQDRAAQPDFSRPVPTRPEVNRPDTSRPDFNRPVPNRPEVNRPVPAQPEVSRPVPNRPEVSRPDMSRREVVRPEVVRPQAVRPPDPPPARERVDNSAFRGNPGSFAPRAASQRGQESRVQVERSAPPPRSANPPAPRVDRTDRNDNGRRR
jgi:hypothetical protein